MSRKSARENAFRLVYEYVETNERNDFSKSILCDGEAPDDVAFTERLYDGVLENFAYLKEIVERYSKDFAFDRIYKTDLAALLIASFEILLCDDVPEKVSVNEAIELSKIYSTDKSPSFVNGVLASVIANREALIHARADH
ncbi:MAG: transcription antitermination factor NusB [Clostridiales bacterium]|nr:transcription antitermination factor NusB [Clostridiales bacterium]